jgi:peroxiredoxin
MKKLALALIALGLSAATGLNAKGYVKFKGLTPADTVMVMRTSVAAYAENGNHFNPAEYAANKTVVPKNGEVKIEFDKTVTEPQVVAFGEGRLLHTFVFTPSDKTEFTFSSTEPQTIAAKGASPLNSKIVESINIAQSIMHQYRNAATSREAQFQLIKQFQTYNDSLLEHNLDNAMGVYLLSRHTSSEDIPTIDRLSGDALTGILAPLVPVMRSRAEELAQMEAEREKNRLHEGAAAPDFTLPDANGNEVALSSLRGKWVMLDFWGTWCGWCVKGIPQMAKEYERLKDRVEFVSVDCGDARDKWLAGIEKHGMTWVNLWNDPNGAQVSSAYSVEGYPTKLIISPEGVVVNITVGEEPDFYKQFDELLK